MGSGIEAILIAIGGLITAIAYWVRQKASHVTPKKPKNTITAEALASRRELHQILESLMLRLTLQTPNGVYPTRVLVINAHNGGSHPRPAVPLFVTIVDEEHLPSVISIREGWIKRPADYAYVSDVLLPLIEKEKILINASELPKGSMTSDALEVQHDDYVYAWFIGIDDEKGETWYLSAHFSGADQSALDSPVVREHMRWAVSESQKFLKLPTPKFK